MNDIKMNNKSRQNQLQSEIEPFCWRGLSCFAVAALQAKLTLCDKDWYTWYLKQDFSKEMPDFVYTIKKIMSKPAEYSTETTPLFVTDGGN